MITQQDVDLMLSTRNPDWQKAVGLGIMGLFLRQTVSEQNSGYTIDRNSRGFNATDPHKGTRWARMVDEPFKYGDGVEETFRQGGHVYGIIPPSEIMAARDMAVKYRTQILDMIQQGELLKEAQNAS